MSTTLSTDVSTGLEIGEQLEERIQLDIDTFKGNLPDRNAIAWHAYLAGLAEWGVISHPVHGRLIKLLPQVEDLSPVEAIILGRE